MNYFDLETTLCFFRQIMFEALAGNGNQGDISIDDITFSESPCSLVFLPSGEPVPCDFEKDSCKYTQETTLDKFDWSRVSGQSDSGPQKDHTLQTDKGNKHRHTHTITRSLTAVLYATTR